MSTSSAEQRACCRKKSPKPGKPSLPSTPAALPANSAQMMRLHAAPARVRQRGHARLAGGVCARVAGSVLVRGADHAL